MDPLSISLACITLIGAISKTSTVVTNFVRDVRGVKSDLDGVSRELQSLKAVLETLANDAGDPTKSFLPETLKRQIAGIVTNCMGVVVEIEHTLERHEGTGLAKAARWGAVGHGDISKLRSSLEAHKSALEIALDMVTLTLAREIKADTREILQSNFAIRQDTADILAEIIRLQAQLTGEASPNNSSGYMLERYLDNLTSYAESVCGTFPDSMSIEDEPEVPVTSEPEATSQRSARSFSDMENDEAEVLNFKSSSNNESTVGEEYSSRYNHNGGEWRRISEEDRSEISVHSPGRVGSPNSAIGGGLQQYNHDTPCDDMEHPQPQDDAQPTPSRQRDSNPTHIHHIVPLESTSFNDYPPRWKTVKSVKLFRGNLILDCPVPERILYKVKHAAPPERDEFTHVRYSALTCRPSEFSDSNFVLRPSIFAKPRSTKLLISISISETDLNSPAKQAAFARTLRSTMQSADNEKWRNHPSGEDVWKNIIICIITDGTVETSSLSLLEEMGLFWNDSKQSSLHGKDMQAHLYEYSVQLIPHIDKLEVKVVKGGPKPVQMMLCLQRENHKFRTQRWAHCFGTSLRADICVVVVPGTVVSGAKLYAIWNATEDQRRPGIYDGLKIIEYPEFWLWSLKRAWMSK